MNVRRLRAATAEQAHALWPAVRSTRLFASPERFAAYRLAEPWRVRATERGEGGVVGRWRGHLRVLAIRGLWCADERVPILAPELVEIAADHGFTSVLSPPAPVDTLDPYLACGFRVAERLVVLQGLAEEIAAATAARPRHSAAAATPALTVRAATTRDLARLAEIDSWCFDSFWGYRDRELAEALAFERMVVATGEDDSIAGYATCSVHGSSATIGRLAVDPEFRRRGVGTALLHDCASWAADKQAFAIGLCTQEHNTGSRALYEAAALEELPTPYALAVRVARRHHTS